MPNIDSPSAQVNLLKKMREEYKNESTLDKLLAKAKTEKKQTNLPKNKPSATALQAPTIQVNENSILEIPPSHCKPWKYADRDQLEMGNIEDLANSIKANGQQEPVLVRQLAVKDGDIEYEVIFGHRRWLACRMSNKPLLAMIRNINDKQAAVAQKEENENRVNLSDYARSQNYTKLLNDNIFSNKTELAAYLGIPRSTLHNILSYSELPTKFITSLQTPHLLPSRTAVKLARLCKEITPSELDILCSKAQLILEGKIPFSKLTPDLFINNENTTSSSPSSHNNHVYKNSMNVKLFTSGLNQNKVPSLIFHKIVLDNNLLPEIERIVLDFLKTKTE